MSKMIVMAVFDAAVNAFNRPFFVPSRGLGVRGFMDEVARKDPGNPMANHPKDFSLHVLGEWDEDTGRFENLEVSERVASATDFFVDQE